MPIMGTVLLACTPSTSWLSVSRSGGSWAAARVASTATTPGLQAPVIPAHISLHTRFNNVRQ